MNLESLISEYGYLAIFIGTFFEGESIMILGGFFAQRGYLDMPWIYFYGFLGTYISESFFYYLGRTRGADFIKRKPNWKRKSRRVIIMLHRHKYKFIIGHRFVYGMRSITPFIIGASGIKPFAFAVLNAVGSFLWTMILGTAGFFFGRTLESYIKKFDEYQHWVLLSVFGLIFILWLISYGLGRYVARPE
ncbi:membrane protein DedA with SNARE-associated domain [Methylohalomonas lacus]|uniref:Membrane protein DedA with SNARE-associated domain n=1 Tax=Methylohalomonas lacus TaxID=398773 RepID=A0AAE3L5B5_9GAMM|nr:DedA family protein [Methylohalomonas lacus]MCS3903057.1 membrane protein DedA with SNARE-associated domain [Methylohalomonas lacus]